MSQPELLEIISATHSSRGLSSRLNRRQQECNQNTDDGDDNQQFDERESSPSSNGMFHEKPLLEYRSQTSVMPTGSEPLVRKKE
jgi:hypothetical protein